VLTEQRQVRSSVGPSRMVQHLENTDSFWYRTPFLSPLRFIRVIRAICGQNASVFSTTNDTDLKDHVTATGAIEPGATNPTWRCPAKGARQVPRGT
jgi:hypothetical protein